MTPHRTHRYLSLLSLLLVTGLVSSASKEQPQLPTRNRNADSVRHSFFALDPHRTAIIICDMWDDHWCTPAAKRCAVLAKKTAPLIDTARDKGITIIHCPSNCMKFYTSHPARVRTLAVKLVEPPKSKELPNPPLPIDDRNGGCDDAQAKFRIAWTKQHEAISIDPKRDFITESGSEVYSILADRKIQNVLVLGVHTNMCVLNRTFAIKQLRRWGVNCYLVRDLTDAMYNPKDRPFVTHDEGTNLVIEYIERYWCPSVVSADIMMALK